MPPRKVIRGPPVRRNVGEQVFPNAPKVQPQGEITYDEFRETTRMLCQVVNRQVGQRCSRHEVVYTSSIHEFFGDESTKLHRFMIVPFLINHKSTMDDLV